MEKGFLTVKEAAAKVGGCAATIRSWIKKGVIDKNDVKTEGRTVYVRESAVKEAGKSKSNRGSKLGVKRGSSTVANKGKTDN